MPERDSNYQGILRAKQCHSEWLLFVLYPHLYPHRTQLAKLCGEIAVDEMHHKAISQTGDRLHVRRPRGSVEWLLELAPRVRSLRFLSFTLFLCDGRFNEDGPRTNLVGINKSAICHMQSRKTPVKVSRLESRTNSIGNHRRPALSRRSVLCK